MRLGISWPASCGFLVLLLLGMSKPAVGQMSSTGDFGLKWTEVLRCEVDSAGFLESRRALRDMVERTPQARRIEAATGMMKPYASDSINMAALDFFASDLFQEDQIRRILFDHRRSSKQRVLLRSYYASCRREYRTSLSSGRRCLALVDLLAERIEALAGRTANYGEQRLLTHLSASMLNCFGGLAERPVAADRLIRSLADYAKLAALDDTFAAASRGWLKLLANPVRNLSSSIVAGDAMGHWDALVRIEASAYLARMMARRPDVVDQVMQMLDDPRDEVRAAAAMSFAVCPVPPSREVITALVSMVVTGRGVVPQSAAAVALSADNEAGPETVELLLGAFKRSKGQPRPGRKRTSSVLSALAGLADQAEPDQRTEMLSVAMAKLSASPSGSLMLLKELGRDASDATDKVVAYRRTADRFERHYIDRHVLPAIRLGRAGQAR